MITPRNLLDCLAGLLALLYLPLQLTAEPYPEPPGIQHFIAIDNVCAWPNLTVLPDGTIIATIFNKPSHGQVAGDVECWASEDGRFWHYRGTPAPHEPNTVRMNVAAGLSAQGDLLVLAAGWTNEQQPGAPKKGAFRDAVLPPWVCRSRDGGRTWQIRQAFPDTESGRTAFVPFGDIYPTENGSLGVSCYAGTLNLRSWKTWFLTSKDDGWTWSIRSTISERHNETAPFYLGNHRWLAACRLNGLELFRSEDNGLAWQGPERVTQPSQHPGHIMRLKDGRLLLTYGNRVSGQKGAAVKIGSADGTTWGDPWQLGHSDGDCGYPSSVQRPDGKIVTAYYSSSSENHRRYHMGVAIWELP